MNSIIIASSFINCPPDAWPMLLLMFLWVAIPLAMIYFGFDGESKASKLHHEECRKQMGRIDLNEKRAAMGLPEISAPRYLDPNSPDAMLLKSKDLWPGAPEGYGGVWFNTPWVANRMPKPGQLHPGIVPMEKLYWKFDPNRK